MYSCNNRRGTGFFQGYQSFWIIVVIAIVVIWVHYLSNGESCCCCNNTYLDNCKDDGCSNCNCNCNSCY